MVSEVTKAGLSGSERALSECLDTLIEERAISLAIKTLHDTEDTFALYREYLVEIGHVINEGAPV
jgi:hypothetical protein